MEELKDASIHHTALKLSEEIKNMKIHNILYNSVQVSIYLIIFHQIINRIMSILETNMYARCGQR